MKSFASDNYAGVLPEVMTALAAANEGHAASYGNDPLTDRVRQLICEQFGAEAVFFVFNGTGANVLSISAATQSYHAVLCADVSHIYNDESSAPETFSGCRFFPVAAAEDGKLRPELLTPRLIRKGDLHFPQISMLTLTQSTEYGTVYTIGELKALSAWCKASGLILHVDGSRFFNAAASLDCSLKQLSGECGIDILSLGGTKLGMMYGEAVLVFNKELAAQLHFKHKQVMQLASKTRFIAAQFEALLQDDLWRRVAAHANAMARQLGRLLSHIPEVTITRPVMANVVFATVPPHWNDALLAYFPFYVWREDINELRLMCAWDTSAEEVAAFAAAFRALSGR